MNDKTLLKATLASAFVCYGLLMLEHGNAECVMSFIGGVITMFLFALSVDSLAQE
jgi:hypothetical protein